MNTRRRYALLVQHARDTREGTALQVLAENAAHDARLLLVQLDARADGLAIRPRLFAQTVPERDAPGGQPRQRATLQAPQRLIAQVVEIDGRNETLQAERQPRIFRGRVDAVGDADQPHLGELEQTLHREQVGLRARQARQVLDENDVDPCRAVRYEAHQALEAGSIGAGAARSAIGEDEFVRNTAAVFLGEDSATPDLVIDARVALSFRGEARVD